MQYAVDRFEFQRELTRRSNHFQEVLRRVPAIIWTTDRAFAINSAAGAGLELLNLDPREIVGKTLEEYFRVTGEAEGVIRAHQRALNGESEVFEAEWQNRCFAIKIDPLHETVHRVAGTIGVAIDVTERRKLAREINFARLVQEALLPAEHPHLEGFDIFGGSYPAKQTCGDWFDYLMFRDGSLGLVVGDVSGKGFGPAILSATIAAYLEVLAEHYSDVQTVLNACNRLVCARRMEGQFSVLALARLEPGVRTLTFGGASDGMLVVGRDGRLKHEITSSGTPLGMLSDIQYDAPAQVALEPGDVLLMLTDGFRESQNAAGDLFGTSRIVATVAANTHAPASEIFDALRREAREFVEGQHQQDDMTGIVVKVLETSSAEDPVTVVPRSVLHRAGGESADRRS